MHSFTTINQHNTTPASTSTNHHPHSDPIQTTPTSNNTFASFKRPKLETFDSPMPPPFLTSLHSQPDAASSSTSQQVQCPSPLTALFNYQHVYASSVNKQVVPGPPVFRGCKQFWKAGDYDEASHHDSTPSVVGMDRVRVHPKFLHSNATSHKWALGALAELLDNAIDESRNGATFVNVDVLKNQKDDSMMLLVEDNGGGMSPDKMRQCMSLGYSAKSKELNTIGQYGNGFKTSTMRLGADVIVFSLSKGKDNRSRTRSIGLLSYTFLIATGKEDIVVPIIDMEKRSQCWSKMIRSSSNDWNGNLDIILKWSPFASEEDLYQQFDDMKDQGTRVIIYNLWEDDEGLMELDFDADPSDIQIRGVNRNEKTLQMILKYPNSNHFLTYRHSLRSYAAILYKELPTGFRIVLRGKDVEHHNIVNDMMDTEEMRYRPQSMGIPDVIVNIGFVKDAHDHVDFQGFNVYHRNRLVKPFWRVWNAAGSDGRGVIGVLEANFVKPAHDKQGFESTNVLQKLENRLIFIQKKYWRERCQNIGYAARRKAESTTSSSRKRTSGIQSSPPANAVNLKGHGSTRCGEISISSAQSLRNSIANQQTQHVSAGSHPEQVGMNGGMLTTSDPTSINTRSEKGHESSSSKNGQTTRTAMYALHQHQQKLESQLMEKTKELEIEKRKSRKLEEENEKLTDLRDKEKKDLTEKLEDAFKEIVELQQQLSKLESCRRKPLS